MDWELELDSLDSEELELSDGIAIHPCAHPPIPVANDPESPPANPLNVVPEFSSKWNPLTNPLSYGA